jgi:para-nitrobenzyl esterase
MCVQAMGGIFGETELAAGSEDCLYLNIFRPSGAKDLPILFFSHGGGLASGAANLEVYLDDPLLAENAIVVTYQYRLGPLGFMAHPDLDAEDPEGSSGNYGFFDAVMALQFIADNAEALGGDRTKLMVFGESAGGQMTHGLLASPLASGLFTAALIQSAPGSQVGKPHEPEAAFGVEVQELLGCENLACMRAKTTTELVEAAPASAGLDTSGHRYSINADGVALTASAHSLASSGALADVPVIIGVTDEENMPFTYGADPGSALALDIWIRSYGAALFGTDGLDDPRLHTLSSYFTVAQYGSPAAAFHAFYADVFTVCPTQTWAGVASGVLDVRTYLWKRGIDATSELGAYHGVELSFIFGTYLYLLNEEEQAMAAYARDAWVSAADGAPSVQGLDWPLYAPESNLWMVLDLVPEVQSEVRSSELCEFLHDNGWPDI